MNRKLAVIAMVIVAIASVVSYNHFVVDRSKNKITVSGAWALYPLMVQWAEEYQKIYPDVTIEVSAGGAGKGMTDALNGLVDIGMVSREITSDETQAGAVYVAVAKDGVVATINKDNPVLNEILTKGVTKQIFYDIFIAGNITNWGQVVGNSSVTDAIHAFTRSDSCGAADTWAKYLGKKQENLLGTGVYGDPGLLEAVKDDRLAIGYNNIGYAYNMETKAQVDGIKVVPIDINGDGQVGTEENFYDIKDKLDSAILQGIYPFPPARNEYLVTKNAFTGATKKFVKWILTDGQRYVEAAGYVHLPQSVLDEQLNKLS